MPTVAASTKLPVRFAEAFRLGSAAPPEAASAAITCIEPSGRTVRVSCVRVRAVTFAPGTGKKATTAPLTTNSSEAPAPPVAVRRASECRPVTKAG